jgi:hypothetical protein
MPSTPCSGDENPEIREDQRRLTGRRFSSFSQYWVDAASSGSKKPAGEAGFA